MGELLVTLTIPPLVGVITYYIVRRVWERDEERSVEGHEQRSDGSQKVIHRKGLVATTRLQKE
jgi:hypothetical protein